MVGGTRRKEGERRKIDFSTLTPQPIYPFPLRPSTPRPCWQAAVIELLVGGVQCDDSSSGGGGGGECELLAEMERCDFRGALSAARSALASRKIATAPAGACSPRVRPRTGT